MDTCTARNVLAIALLMAVLPTCGGAPNGPSCGSLTDCDGSCADTSVDPQNCGACNKACDPGQVCSDGVCGLSCAGGSTKCGGQCVDTGVDPQNCGACNTECAPGEVCSDGACSLPCALGYIECQGTCVNTDTDTTSCGVCGNACAPGEVCSDGVCELTCSAGGTTDCGGQCVDTNVDPNNCGACNKACAAGEVCFGGACSLSCGGGTIECQGACINTQVDPMNCGACQNACPTGEVCSGGICDVSCSGGTTLCNGVCVDSMLDPAHCGGCGNACPEGEVCSGGTCNLVCVGDTKKCGDVCVDWKLDPNNCGDCGTTCLTTETCSNGSCVPYTCTSSTLFEDTFADSSKGWTLGPQWQIGPAMSSSMSTIGTGFGDPDSDVTPTMDNGVAGVVIGGLATSTQGAFSYLESPVIDAEDVPGLTLSLYRWLNTFDPPYMDNVIEVFDGADWIEVWPPSSATLVIDSSWRYMSFDVTAYANSMFRFRIGFADFDNEPAGEPPVLFPSWNVDDVRVTAITCQ